MRRPFSLPPFLVFLSIIVLFPFVPSEASAQDSQKLNLDGDQDYATASDNSSLSITGQSITVEAWIKHDGSSDADAMILDKQDGGHGYQLSLVGSGEEVPVKFRIGNFGTSITSKSGIPADTWTHVAATYDGTNLTLYVNGELDRQFGDDTEISDGATSLYLGTTEAANGRFFSGQIDEVRVWNGGRSQLELKENRFSELTGSENGLVAYYPFGASSPTTDRAGSNDLTFQGDASAESPDVFPVPPNLYVENEGNGQVSLQWEERTGPNGANAASSFNVYSSPPTGLSGRSEVAQPSASASTYTATDLSNGKTYFWEVTAEDGSGNESDFSPLITGTPYNGSEPTPMKGGAALSLDGDLDYAAASDRPSLSITGQSITVEAWIKHDGSSDADAMILDKQDGGHGYQLSLVGSGEEVPVKFRIGNFGTSITSKSGIPADTWTHVAATYDGTNLTLYVNGELDRQFGDDTEISDGATSLYLGTTEAANGRFFSGQIDEVRVWNGGRTEQQIQANYQQELVGNEDGLQAYWRFNDAGKGVRQDRSTGYATRHADAVLQGDAALEGPGALPLPPRLYAQAGDASVELSWAERRSGAANQFRVYRATASDGSDRSLVTTESASTTSYTDDGASNATNTFHEATVVNAAGQESDHPHPAPTTPSTQYFGNALALDGDQDYGTVGDRPSLSFEGPEDQMTVEAWIRHDGSSDADAMILDKTEGNKGYELRLVGSGEEVPVRFDWGNFGGSITSNTNIAANTWTHVAAVNDGNELHLYVNGTHDNTNSDGGTGVSDGATPLQFGTTEAANEQFFSGRIDEVRIWDVARTETEVEDHYRQELAGNEDGLLAYFRFNETPGTSVSRAAAERPKTVALNGDADFASSLSLYPSTLSATISRSFGGAASSSDYRLVALPGDISRPLADVVSGEAGLEWQAYHDDGTDSDFLKKYDGSDTFTLEPGAGFWLTATSDWTHDVNASTVSLQGDSAAVIGLQDGWNVVSNPTDRAVSYDRLVTANQAAANGSLQPLWAFDGTFNQADSMDSAAEGVAYYFLNDQGLDSLRIPYPGLSTKKKSTDRDAPDLFRLAATPADVEGASASTVQLGFTKDAPARSSVVAPPGRFESVSLRIAPEAAAQRPARQRFLMRTRQSIGSEGSTFDLQLTSRTNGPIHLSVENPEALGGQSARLLVPSKGTSHDLTAKGPVPITPSGEDMNLRLAVGTQHYVETQAAQITPDEVALTTYPNPVHQQGTLEYTLPEAGKVTLRVYDVLGREVATLVDGRKEAGRHTVRLATDQLSSGVYFGRLTAGKQHRTQKMTVVR